MINTISDDKDIEIIIDNLVSQRAEDERMVRQKEIEAEEESWKEIVEEFFDIKGTETPELEKKGLSFAHAHNRLLNMYEYIRKETACFSNN